MLSILPRFPSFLLRSLLSFLMVVLVASCTGNPAQLGNQALLSPGATGGEETLRVITNPTYPPFSFQQEDGTLAGFDIDLMRAVAQTANLNVSFETVPFFDDVIRNIYARRSEAAVIALTITPDRLDVVSFSRPYFKSGLAIAVPDTSPPLSIEQLQGKRIGVESGTTGAARARAIPAAQVVSYDTASIALKELELGNVDAVLNDMPATAYAIRTGSVKNIKLAGEAFTEDYYGIAVPRDSVYLDRINAALAAMFGNGTYASLYRKWFDGEPPALPERAPGQRI